MRKFRRTAIAIADAKETALYFDYVIPVNLGVDVIRGRISHMRHENSAVSHVFLLR